LTLNQYKHDNSLQVDGVFVAKNDTVKSLEIFYLYENGGALYFEIGYGEERISDIIEKLSNTTPTKHSEFESGAYKIVNGNIFIETIAHYRYGKYRVRKFQGDIRDQKYFCLKYDLIDKQYKRNLNRCFHLQNSKKPDSTNWLMNKRWYRAD
jgi:transposase